MKRKRELLELIGDTDGHETRADRERAVAAFAQLAGVPASLLRSARRTVVKRQAGQEATDNAQRS